MADETLDPPPFRLVFGRPFDSIDRDEAEGGHHKAEWRTWSSGNAALQSLLGAWPHRERHDEVIETPEVEGLGDVRDGPCLNVSEATEASVVAVSMMTGLLDPRRGGT